MATSYATEPRPEFTSEVKGNKVILSRKVDEPKPKAKTETPEPPDANTTPEPPVDKQRGSKAQS